jgi:hypothetical protein
MKVSKLGRHHWARVSPISQSELGSVLVFWGARRSLRRALKPLISSAEAGR